MEFAEEFVIPVIAVAGFYAVLIVWIYLFFSSRNRIRMALIEQGKDASIFKVSNDRTLSLRNGLVAIMVGIGLILGYLLEEAGMSDFVAYLSMVLIMGGLGLVGFYTYARNRIPMEETV